MPNETDDCFRIIDGNMVIRHQELFYYCDGRMPEKRSFISTNNNMIVMFDSITNFPIAKGFRLQYTTVSFT